MNDIGRHGVPKPLPHGRSQTTDLVDPRKPNCESPKSDFGGIRTRMANRTNELLAVQDIGQADTMRARELRTF